MLDADKKTLQQRSDSMYDELSAKTKANEELTKTVEGLKLDNQALNVELSRYIRTNRILIVTLIVLAIAIGVVGNYVYKKYIKKRTPSLIAAPMKRKEIKEPQFKYEEL